MHPGFAGRDRQASTQISSQRTTEDEEQTDDETDIDSIDIDDPERPRIKRKRSESFYPSKAGR
jgi:hypothetical protein